MKRDKQRKNYGFGNHLKYAGEQALRLVFGQGRFATRAAHAARWGRFCAWLKIRGIKDARVVTTAIFMDYANHLGGLVEAGAMEIAYAQNIISSCNVVLSCLRGDHLIR